MSDARQAVPSLDEQMNAFKGFTTVEGETRPEKPEEIDMAARVAAEGKPAPAKPAPAKPAPAKKAVAAEEDDDEGEGEGEGEGETKPAAKPKNDPQARINKAIGRQRAAERARDAADARAASLEARLAALEAGKPLTPQNGAATVNKDVRPDPAKYQYGELDTKFISDLARFEAREEMKAERERDTKSSQTRQQREAAAAHEAKMTDFQDKGLEEFEDFDEVVMESAKRGEWALTDVIGELILESEDGPKIAYHLATHPKEAAKVAKLSPARQAIWFGQKEAELSSAKPDAGAAAKVAQRVSQAPPLPTNRARGAGGRIQVSPDTNDFAAFEAMAMRRQ